MVYPTYRAKGWPIGSGSVDAACKQVVNARLKGTGLRWGKPGADAICAPCSEAKKPVGRLLGLAGRITCQFK